MTGGLRGRGVAGGFWFNGTGPASAIASVLPDGSVSLVEGSPDLSGTRTAAAMMFAETLEIPVDRVRPQVGDTDTIGYTSGSGGSSATFKTGWAVHEAALDVRRQLIERAAKVQVLRYTALQDVGRAIHPSYVEGQIHGGVAQGLGWALHEEYMYDQTGRMENANFLDYRMPTALDVPAIETVLIEVPNPGHPYGVRGVGEVPIVPPLAAISNAVARAAGNRHAHEQGSPHTTEDPRSARHGRR
ncbi:MAG: xanthine dehydrogenase family protein molybdopterin-binding subunit [Dehalococcoidia bacterium]